MYICICHGVSEKKLTQHVLEHNCSMREVKKCLGVGNQCGKCVPAAQAVISQTKQQQALLIQTVAA